MTPSDLFVLDEGAVTDSRSGTDPYSRDLGDLLEAELS